MALRNVHSQCTVRRAASGPPNRVGDWRIHAQPVRNKTDTLTFYGPQFGTLCPKIGFVLRGGRTGGERITEEIIRDRFWHRVKGKHCIGLVGKMNRATMGS